MKQVGSWGGLIVRAASLPEIVKQGEAARLIPTVAETSKERRIMSCLLAVLMAVDEFGKTMLETAGVKVSNRAKLECFTEVILRSSNNDQSASLRPDGLIQVRSGSKVWTALVEAKVGTSELKADQVEAYLDLAKANKVDAIITVSNQFASLPTHHPISVGARKRGKIEMYHWSWTGIQTEATLLADHKGVSDPDQAFMLDEFIRYLEHDSSGVNPFPRMGKAWKDVCTTVQQAVPLRKNSDEVIDTVGEWHQLTRYLALKLGGALGTRVSVAISRVHAKDPEKRLKDEVASFCETQRLEVELEIPDAAARMLVQADLRRRCAVASMKLLAPKDKTRQSASVNWALRQLKKCEDQEVVIRALWPRRATDTSATLGQLVEDPSTILNPDTDATPVAFEFQEVIDMGGRFKGARTFVDEISPLPSAFYKDVGQYLKNWIPPAPKVKEAVASSADLIGTGSPDSVEP